MVACWLALGGISTRASYGVLVGREGRRDALWWAVGCLVGGGERVEMAAFGQTWALAVLAFKQWASGERWSRTGKLDE